MHYPDGRESRAVLTRLVRDESDSCWIVSDLITPSEVALLRLLRLWHGQNGPKEAKGK